MFKQHVRGAFWSALSLAVLPIQALSIEPPTLWMIGPVDQQGPEPTRSPIYRFPAGVEPGEPVAELEWVPGAPGWPHDLAFGPGNRLFVGGRGGSPIPEVNYALVWRVEGPPFLVDLSSDLACSREGIVGPPGSPGIDFGGGSLWFADRRTLNRCQPPPDGTLPWEREEFALPTDLMGNKALAVHEGKVYVGLYSSPDLQPSLSVFDPDTELFSEVGPLPAQGDVFIDFDQLGRLWIAHFAPEPPGAGGQPISGLLILWRVDDLENYELTEVSAVLSPAISGMAIAPGSVLEVPGLGALGSVLLSLLVAATGCVFLVSRS